MKVCTVVGARPQFVKAATLSRAIARHNAAPGAIAVEERIVHTGQHYDANMSDVFFEELGIPKPAHHLGVGSGSHGKQTGRMLEEIEAILVAEKPDWMLVYGDTNSTLAGALAAAKLHVPIAHVEAGLRSFNRRMPEEVNRVMADHLSSLLLVPTAGAIANLAREGIEEGVVNVGDVMYDSVLHYRVQIERNPRALRALGLEDGGFYLATVHRAENTDSTGNLRGIFAAFGEIQKRHPVIVALHPRTRQFIDTHGIAVPRGVRLLEPVSYFDMIELEFAARMIFTDSGGVQKEAFFARRPCLTLREETEWVETTACNANRLCGASTSRILEGFALFDDGRLVPDFDARPYGDGNAAGRIVETLARFQRPGAK
jgi:UDP-GlcNAc3NAcA epimerase